MKKYFTVWIGTLILSITSLAKEKSAEVFSDPETNFKLVLQALQDKYVDKNLSKEELYRAATAGMLNSLNTPEQIASDHTPNQLISTRDMQNLKIEMTGNVVGIGVTLRWDEHNGYGQVLQTLAHSPAEKAGIKIDDQILSVDGKKYKGKKLEDLAADIRGEAGTSVELKILREDKIINMNIVRSKIQITEVTLDKIDPNTAVLYIGTFNDQTLKLVKEKIQSFKEQGFKKLILDLRNNDGGVFEEAVKVAELFLSSGDLVVETKGRGSEAKKYVAGNEMLGHDVQIVLLTNKNTYCGAELLVAALKENRHLKSVGEATFGKANIQSLETLPNGFAYKYTVEEFISPQGHSYQNVGIKPDLEVLLPKDVFAGDLRAKYDIGKRLAYDTQLKAALELIKAN